VAQDERREFDIVDDFPFMLRVSKHSEPFFSNLLSLVRDPKVEPALLSQRLTDLLGKAKIENPLRRHRVCGFDALGGDRDHFALERFIDGVR
jgi:hypothetical protein